MTDQQESADVANPRLTQAEVDAIEPSGLHRRLADGESLFQAGARRGGFFVVLEGRIEVIDLAGDYAATPTELTACKGRDVIVDRCCHCGSSARQKQRFEIGHFRRPAERSNAVTPSGGGAAKSVRKTAKVPAAGFSGSNGRWDPGDRSADTTALACPGL
ncbi:hypothetical protein BH23GEM3_BH23GEM3_10490 [soil metagenome]